MKKTFYILTLMVWAIISMGVSCDDKLDISFEDVEKYTIYDYIIQNQDQYSSFLSILEKGGLDKTLSAYNSNGDGFTLFLPTNAAIDSFIEESEDYASLQELLDDEDYLWYFCRYHVVNEGIDANDFPFGAFSEFTLTEDYLAVSFFSDFDTAYYKINNQAPVIQPNIELSNGFVHVISKALIPITLTAYDWISVHEGYSLFKAAVDTTGLKDLFSINPKIDENKAPFTLFLEHDSIFAKKGIYTMGQLINLISPDREDFTSPLNPLYNFVGYHVLSQHMFLDDFEGEGATTNYSTYSDIPLHVDGHDIDILINKGKEIFDTIVHSVGDTTFINYVGINYDASNVITQSGVIHFIDRILTQQTPSMAVQTYEIYERPFFDEFSIETGSFLIEDSTLLNVISYSGSELTYIKYGEAESMGGLWSQDCIHLDGDFTVSYRIPKIVQGSYNVFLQADFLEGTNAVVEVFIDGKPIGGTVDLANAAQAGATRDNPFRSRELGSMTFLKYDTHTVTVKSLIPGTFSWDFIRFEPL